MGKAQQRRCCDEHSRGPQLPSASGPTLFHAATTVRCGFQSYRELCPGSDPALALPCCVTLSKSLHLSGPQFLLGKWVPETDHVDRKYTELGTQLLGN